MEQGEILWKKIIREKFRIEKKRVKILKKDVLTFNLISIPGRHLFL
jgi:hypothetical protein